MINKKNINKGIILFLSFLVLGILNLKTKGEINEGYQKKARVSFVGDLMNQTLQLEYSACSNGYDYNPSFSIISDRIKNSDLAVGNLETVVSERFKPCGNFIKGFNAPLDYLKAVKNAGFDIVSTANNHSYDCGKKGVIDTIKSLDKVGLGHFGSSTNYKSKDRVCFRNVNEIKVAFISYSYGFNIDPFCKRKIKDSKNNSCCGFVNKVKFNEMNSPLSNVFLDINYAKSNKADFIVVMPHWGYEYYTTPCPYNVLADKSHKILEQGADVIIGSHPHVIQKSEDYKTKDGRKCFIAYSLGNFISSYSTLPRCLSSIVSITFAKENTNKTIDNIEICPTYEVKYIKKEKNKKEKIELVIVDSKSLFQSSDNKKFLGLKNYLKECKLYQDISNSYNYVLNLMPFSNNWVIPNTNFSKKFNEGCENILKRVSPRDSRSK